MMQVNTLIDLVHSFEQRKHAIAIIEKTGYRTFRYSYHDIYRLSRRTAHLLDAMGITKGDRVLLWGQNSVAWVSVFFGCIMRGAVVVPLDARSRPEFIRRVQGQVGAKAFFCSRYRQDPKLPAKTIKAIFLEDLEAMLGEYSEKTSRTPLKHPLKQDDLVEILYTSGTTGEPKGVMLTHGNLCFMLQALHAIETPAATDGFLSLLPLSHVFEQMLGLLYPLRNGASVCYLPALKQSAILEALKKEHITLIVLVPRFLEMFRNTMLAAAEERGRKNAFLRRIERAKHLPCLLRKMLFTAVHRRFGSLRHFIVGGAPLPAELEAFWENLGFSLLQGYGLTETSPIVSCNTPRDRKTGSVGKILQGVDIAIAPDGELWVKGENVSPGYYHPKENHPKEKTKEKTQESFDRGWFRTGDIGYLDKEGFLFISGRKKDMIKTAGGMNVYAEDVEEALNGVAGVKDSCVIGVQRAGHEEVHAVLLLDDERDGKRKHEPERIIREANQKLDSAQQIQGFTVWPFNDFPRTTTLKVKKFAVREYAESIESFGSRRRKEEIVTRAPLASDMAAIAMTSIEDRLYAILRQLAREPRTIPEKAALGLDLRLNSIDRVELVSRIEQEMNVDIDEGEILATTTVKELEQLIQNHRQEEEKQSYRRWLLSWPLRALRACSQEIMWFPLTRVFCSPMLVKGTEHMRSLIGPVVFVANHQSHLDTPVILMSLPRQYRCRIVPAAWKEYFDAQQIARHDCLTRLKLWFLYNFVSLDFNAYLFPQHKGFRRAMQYTGELLDRGWSVLLFPEGTRSMDGKLLPFKPGIGFIAAEMKVPIVPVRVDGLVNVLSRGKWWPRKGKVSVTFGKPMVFTKESRVEIVNRVERAIREL